MWILLWMYVGYGFEISDKMTQAVVVEDNLTWDTKAECDIARANTLNTNDTRYMIAHHTGLLVCVQVPKLK